MDIKQRLRELFCRHRYVWKGSLTLDHGDKNKVWFWFRCRCGRDALYEALNITLDCNTEGMDVRTLLLDAHRRK